MHLFFLGLMLGSLSGQLKAYEVIHLLRPGSNFTSLASAGACQTFVLDPGSYRCNPANYSLLPRGKFRLSLLGKTEGRSIDATRKFFFEKFDLEALEDILGDKNYLSFAGQGEILFETPFFALSYSPLYLLVDLLIFNPAIPRVNAILLERRYLSFTTSISTHELFPDQFDFNLSVGANLRYVWDEYFRGTFLLSDFTQRSIDEIVSNNKDRFIEMDLALSFQSDYFWIPDLALQVRNLGSPYVVAQEQLDDLFSIQNQALLEPYWEYSIGKSFESSFGGLGVEVKFPSKSFFSSFTEDVTLGGRYHYSLFSLYASTSFYIQTLGLQFISKSSRVGLLYSYEREVKDFNLDKDNTIYLNVGIDLL